MKTMHKTLIFSLVALNPMLTKSIATFTLRVYFWRPKSTFALDYITLKIKSLSNVE
jgi:hypothetical protein